LWVGLAVAALLIALSRIVTQVPGSSGTAVDNTGATRRPMTRNHGAPSPAPPTPVIANNVSLTRLTSGPLLLLNPAFVRQGATINLSGSGFDPKATLDLVLRRNAADRGQPITFAQADKGGAFTTNFTVSGALGAGSFIIEARERDSGRLAQATGTIAQGTAPQVKLGIQVGRPGDQVVFSAQGFAPGEALQVYWNSLLSPPLASLHTDAGGNVRTGAVTVPFGAVGNNAFIFLGAQSQAPVTDSFLTLSLYPTVQISSYAIQAGNPLTFSGKAFGPGERIQVYLNTLSGPPLTTVQANVTGTFGQTSGFVVPFALKGSQTLIFIGEQSRAPATVNFDILPYTPTAQPSTYGGLPGTTVSFYASGFAHSEVVHVYVGRTATSTGDMVTCFRADSQGSALAAGAYTVPGSVAAGKLTFALDGVQSGATATATFQVMPSTMPVHVAQPPAFTCPLDQPSAGASPSPTDPTAPASSASGAQSDHG
jgi:hypothetical protein